MNDLCTAKLDGTDVQEVAIGDCPSWSADGQKIACCYVDPAKPAPLIRIVDLATKEQSFVGFGWFRINWAADGKSVFANGITQTGERGIFRVPLEEGATPDQIFPVYKGAESPTSSWDGKRLVFVLPTAKH